jgi:hypothetical protein
MTFNEVLEAVETKFNIVYDGSLYCTAGIFEDDVKTTLSDLFIDLIFKCLNPDENNIKFSVMDITNAFNEGKSIQKAEQLKNMIINSSNKGLQIDNDDDEINDYNNNYDDINDNDSDVSNQDFETTEEKKENFEMTEEKKENFEIIKKKKYIF